jgi:hypothetical protein
MTAPHLLAARNRARAKTIRTIGNLLIETLLLVIIASQTGSVKIKNAEVA